MVSKALLSIGVTLLVASVGACVDVGYQRPSHTIVPRAGQVLLVGQLRFFLDEVEFFPWKPALLPDSAWRAIERHLWLLRLGKRAVSPELHPDPDGSLAVWLASGDYALVGDTEIPTTGPSGFEVLALVRVPDGPISANAGQLIFKTERHEGWFAKRGTFGVASVVTLPVDDVRANLEERFGSLPEPPVVSPWCVGENLPGFNDPDLMTRAREILDRGCMGQPGRRGLAP
jgi:hypothetical protein